MLSNLERPLITPISRSRHSLTLNISETVRDADIVPMDVSSLSWLCSYTSRWMVQLLATCLMTASLPSARLYEGDMNSLLLLLCSLNTRMNGVESMIATIAIQVHASQQVCQHQLVQQPDQQSHNKQVHGRQAAISGAWSISSVRYVSSLPSNHTTNSTTSCWNWKWNQNPLVNGCDSC